MDIPPEVRDIAVPGGIGSAISLRWVPGGWRALPVWWLSGTSLVWLIVPSLVEHFELSVKSGYALAGTIGMIGMLIAAKVVETIQALDVKQFAQAIMDRFKKWLGVA